MKHSAHYLVAALVLSVHLSAAGDEPAITAFSLSDGRANLRWQGAAPPFEIESSTGLAGWTRVLQTMDSSASAPAGEDAAFFRVRGEQPAPGSFLGQLRVDEGEFGKPLARHRLKSLWDFHLPADETASSIPELFFRQLTLRLVYREGEGLRTFTGTLSDLPGAVVTTEARKMSVTWTFGQGDDRRDYLLELTFRYDIDARRQPIHLSDPSYKLTCTYATSQPEAGYADGLTMVNTRIDSVSLYQLAEQKPPAWLRRDARFRADDVSFAFQYDLGVPMLEGGPAFIWKTPILDVWHRSSVTGLTTEPLVITDRFSQTYKPGHHNFVEDFWVEPALIPGLAAETLEELREANIRFIVATHPSAFPGSPSTMKLVGFDLKVR